MKVTINQALQLALAAYDEGKLNDAEKIYGKILNSQPSNPDANYNLALIAVSQKKTDAAFLMFQKAIDANPKIEEYWLSLIDFLIKEKEFASAKTYLAQARAQGVGTDRLNFLDSKIPLIGIKEEDSAINPPKKISDILLRHYRNERWIDAEKLSDRIMHNFPGYTLGWKILGIVSDKLGKNLKALKAKQRAVLLSPDEFDAHLNLGNSLKAFGRLDDAESNYKKAAFINPNDAYLHYNIGNSLRSIGRLEAAIKSYRKTLDLQIYHKAATFNLIHVLRKLDRKCEIIYLLRRFYVFTLSTEALNIFQLTERKRGKIKNFAKLDRWYCAHLGIKSPVMRVIDTNYKLIAPLVPQIKKALKNVFPDNNMGIPYLEGSQYIITGDVEYVVKIEKILKFVFPKKEFYTKATEGIEKYFVTLNCIDSMPNNFPSIIVPVSHGHPASFWSGLENVIQNDDVNTETIVSALFASRSALGLNYLKAEDLQRIQTDPRKLLVLDILADSESCASYDETVSGNISQRSLSYYKNLVNHTQYFDYISYKDNAVILNIGVAEGFELPALLKFFGQTSKIYNIDPDGYSNLTPASRDCVDRNPHVFKLLSLAVSDSDGQLSMDVGFMPEDARVRRRNTGNIQSVPCNRLSSIVNKIGIESVDFIKIDIEGGEEFILDDLISVANKYRPEICLSIYHNVDHIFDMPLRMAEGLQEYKYYFKRYSPVFEEATLYCIPA